MPTDFRSELFALCKVVQKKEGSREIGELIHTMSTFAEPIKPGMLPQNSHGDFAQVAKHSNNEFHGFLFVDDNVETISTQNIFRLIHLSSNERTLLENGHRTLTRFIELCLSDICCKSSTIAEIMNPYSFFKPVKLSPQARSLISDEEFAAIVSSFKNGRIYSALMATNFPCLYEKINVTSLQILMSSIEKEVNQSLGEDVAEDLKELSLKIGPSFKDISEIMLSYSLLIYALKSSLALACKTLYKAICGVDLFVLNNNNIISIEKITTTAVCKFYKVFSIDIAADHSGSGVGSIILIDCDPKHGQHIHEFGMITSQTFNFGGEFGESAKYSFVVVDREMNIIDQLTNAILLRGLPNIVHKGTK